MADTVSYSNRIYETEVEIATFESSRGVFELEFRGSFA